MKDLFLDKISGSSSTFLFLVDSFDTSRAPVG